MVKKYEFRIRARNRYQMGKIYRPPMAAAHRRREIGKPAMGIEKRRFHRVRPSGLVPKTGMIFADLKSPASSCFVVDISAGGACLDVPGSAPIPRRFTLNHGGTKKSCYLVWQKGRRIGVSF
jgi:hypothetical protein